MAMPATVTAQEGELTLDDLFATPKLTGTTPSRPAWAPNSEHFAFSWSEPGQPGRGLWVSTSDGKDVRLRFQYGIRVSARYRMDRRDHNR